MLPSSAELHYFYEAAKELNLSRASLKLSMSQPSLSLAIQRLEKSIGVALFVRHKKGVTLTQAGKKLLLQVKPLLQYWDNTKAEMIASHRHIVGEVTIGCPATFGYFMHEPIANLLTSYPALSLHLHLEKSNKITEHVISSNLDIGIVMNPTNHPDLILRKLYDSEMTFWSSIHSSATQDIDSNKLVIICDENLPQTQLLLKKWKHKIARARILPINDLSIIAHLTAEGCGLGILSACFVKKRGGLLRVPNAPGVINKLYLISRYESKQVKSIEVTIQSIMKFIKSS